MSGDRTEFKFHERIQTIMDHFFNGKQSGMKDGTGISQPMIHHLVKADKKTGKYPLPSLSTLWTILDALPEINRRWLFFGEGEMLLNTYPLPVVGQKTDGVDDPLEEYILKCTKPLYRLEDGVKLSDILSDRKGDSYFTLPGITTGCDGGVVVSGSVAGPLVSEGDIILFQKITTSKIISRKRYLIAVENEEGEEEISLEYIIRGCDNRTIQTFASKPDELRSIDLKRVRTLLLVVGFVSYQP